MKKNALNHCFHMLEILTTEKLKRKQTLDMLKTTQETFIY